MIRRCVLALSVLVAWLPVGRAQPPKGAVVVSLQVDPCVKVDVTEVRRLFRLEMATSLPNAVEGTAGATTRVTAGCKAGQVELQVIDALTAKVLVRRIRLGDKGRERLLALAIMELLVASWVELAATPRPRVTPVGGRGDIKTRRDASNFFRRKLRDESWEVSTTLRGGLSVGSIGMAGAGALSVNLDAPNGFGWGVDMMLERTTDRLALGEVTVSSFAAAVSIHLHRRWNTLRLRGALGARAGGVTMSGQPGQPGVVGRSLTALSAGPLLRASASKPLVDKVMIELWLDTGYHLFPVRGLVNGDEQASVTGPWLAAHVGVGWQW